MRILISICIVLSLFGCQRPGKSPDANWIGTVRILPIIVKDSAGETSWSAGKISNNFKDTNLYWKDIGIQFKVMEPDIVTSDAMFEQNGKVEWAGLMIKSKRIAEERHVYPIYFVNNIKWGDNVYGGMSTVANSPSGFQYGTMISGTNGRSGRTVSHELGHAWNLRHTWQDRFDDTTSSGSKDCNASIKCNVMSYCPVHLDCVDTPFFTPEQIEEVRKWAFSGGRIHLLETDIVTIMSDFPLLDEVEIIKDPVFGGSNETP